MISFPNAKINIGLFITGKRSNGYHNLASVFYPVPLHDVLEIVPSDSFRFQTSGLPIPGNPENNLIIRAFKMLHQDFRIPQVSIHLHKVIPMGAGLGGGSADATFTLKTLNALFNLNLSNEALEGYAVRLGADCPFFVKNKPTYVTGIGEELEEIPNFIQQQYLTIVCPGIHISTKEAFQNIPIESLDFDLKSIVRSNPKEWKGKVKNSFEGTVLPIHHKLEKIKSDLYELGANYVSMSGTGSSIYAFSDHPIAFKDGFSFGINL